MYLTVREVLQMPPLGELRLVAGEAGLDRHVTRVSVLEIVGGNHQWLRGGELFMTTLHILRDAACEEHVAVLRNLVAGHVAALILHPGLTGFQHLDEMCRAADELSFPLILMPDDMPYAVVTDAVMGGLLGRQAALLERSAAVNRELIQVALRGGDLDDICRTVARRTRQPVAVVGADGDEVLADSGKTGDPRRLLPTLLEHRVACGPNASTTSFHIPAAGNIRGPRQVQTSSLISPSGTFSQVAAPVITHDEICAYLLTWEAYGRLSELDFTVLAHACTAVGLEVLKQRAVLEAERRVQRDFYSAALSGAFTTLEEAEHHAQHSGVELAERYVVVAFEHAARLSPAGRRQIDRWLGSVSLMYEGTSALVLHVPLGLEQPLDDAIALVRRALDDPAAANRAAVGGISCVAQGILSVPEALRQARAALAIAGTVPHEGECRPPGPTLLRYDQLGIFQLLAGMADKSMLSRFHGEALQPLLASRGGSGLVRTLEAYLDTGGSHLAAARVLKLHPNTIKYRLGKIRALLGEEALADPWRRLGLHVAVKAHRLLA